MRFAWIKAILALPFNAAITIPLLVLYFSGCLHFSKNTALICLGLALFLLGFFLSLWTMLLFANIGRGTLAPWNPTKKVGGARPLRLCEKPHAIGSFNHNFGRVFYILLAGRVCMGFALLSNKYFILYIL